MVEEISKKEKERKKNQFFLIKIVASITLLTFGYFAFKYYSINKDDKTKSVAEIAKEDISDIFDFSDEYKSAIDSHDFSDLTVNELKEKGAEFVYQMLLKNQMQINDLRQQTQELKNEFLKYKNYEKIGKIIFAYVEFRQDLYSGRSYQESLRNFEMLIYADEKLREKITILKPFLNDFVTARQLEKVFADMIPTLITHKNQQANEKETFISKLRVYLSKLIVIRRIDGKVENDVDGLIVKIEKSLGDEEYQEALVAAAILDQSHHEILAVFMTKLNAEIEVRKIDQDILNHLKSLN